MRRVPPARPGAASVSRPWLSTEPATRVAPVPAELRHVPARRWSRPVTSIPWTARLPPRELTGWGAVPVTRKLQLPAREAYEVAAAGELPLDGADEAHPARRTAASDARPVPNPCCKRFVRTESRSILLAPVTFLLTLGGYGSTGDATFVARRGAREGIPATCSDPQHHID